MDTTYTSIDEGKEIIQRIYRSSADGSPPKLRRGKITREYREHCMRLIALELGAPYPRSLKLIAADLGISTVLIRKWRKTQKFLDVCEEVQEYLFQKYEILINGKLIEKALEGSKWHMDTYYNIRGRLKQRVVLEHTGPRTSEAVDQELKEIAEKSPELRKEISELMDVGAE